MDTKTTQKTNGYVNRLGGVGEFVVYNALNEGDWFISSANYLGTIIRGCILYPAWEDAFLRFNTSITDPNHVVLRLPKVIISEVRP